MGIEVSVFEQATIEDLYNDPKKYGAPSFEDFCKNYDKYTGTIEAKLDEVDKAPIAVGSHVNKIIYDYNGHRTESLEKMQHILLSEGVDLKSLKYEPEFLPDTSFKGAIVVKFKGEVHGSV